MMSLLLMDWVASMKKWFTLKFLPATFEINFYSINYLVLLKSQSPHPTIIIDVGFLEYSIILSIDESTSKKSLSVMTASTSYCNSLGAASFWNATSISG